MRMIGSLQNENEARRFAGYLKRKGIETSIDGSFDAATGKMTYPIWVHDEDKIAEAQIDFAEFIQSPTQAAFDTPITAIPQGEAILEEPAILAKRAVTPFTTFILSLCVCIFFLNFLQEKTVSQEMAPQKIVLMTPIQTLLLFDLPPSVEKIEKIMSSEQAVPVAELEELANTPFWHGIYDWIVFKLRGQDTALVEGPLFQKIAEGEVWRLFSPAVLHTELLHILFNMIWVWVLSRPIEQRIGMFRLALLTLIVGIGSNTIQYLMSGPFFLGYSGVVMGLAGFTWMREKKAPWEGYPMPRSTILFLLIFVFGMFAAQAVSFIFQAFTNIAFSLNIANAAHISGALIGAALGSIPFFAVKGPR